MGNHDAFSFDEDSFYGILGEKCRPYDRTLDGMDLIFLDACYFRSGRHYTPGIGDWTDTYIPHVAELRDRLLCVRGKAYLFMHQNLDAGISDDHRLYNADEICSLLEASGAVKTVYQGHYHPGNRTTRNSVHYVTLPAMCENENAFLRSIYNCNGTTL